MRRSTACTSPTTSWPSTVSCSLLGHAQGHVEHGPVLGGVDVGAGEHGVTAGLDAGGPGQVDQERQRLVGDPMLGVVQDEIAGSGGQTGRPLGVVGEELAQVEIADVAEVRCEGLPLRSAGRIERHYLTSLVVVTGRGLRCGHDRPARGRVPPRCPVPRCRPAAFSVQEPDNRGTPSGPARGSRGHLRRGPARPPGSAGPAARCSPLGRCRRNGRRRPGRTADGAETVPGVVVAPRLELEGGAPRRLGGAAHPGAGGRTWHRPSPVTRRRRFWRRRAASQRVVHHLRSGATSGPRPPAGASSSRGSEAPPGRRPTRCRPGRAAAPGRGAVWRALGPPCRRRSIPMTRHVHPSLGRPTGRRIVAVLGHWVAAPRDAGVCSSRRWSYARISTYGTARGSKTRGRVAPMAIPGEVLVDADTAAAASDCVRLRTGGTSAPQGIRRSHRGLLAGYQAPAAS